MMMMVVVVIELFMGVYSSVSGDVDDRDFDGVGGRVAAIVFVYGVYDGGSGHDDYDDNGENTFLCQAYIHCVP